LERAEQDLIDEAVIEQRPKIEGRNATMIVAQKKKNPTKKES
jgi:translation initiation factor IF-3